MLSELRIKNFALIDDADIIFLPGLDVLIGETGAGKTLVVEAIALLEGKRAEFDKLRDETQKAFIEGTFTLSEDFIKSHGELKEYLDGNTLTANRTLLPSKSALARINGETVSLATLKDIMSRVIDVHSQQDTSLLYDMKNYRPLLDAYGAKKRPTHKKALEAFKEAFKAYKEAVGAQEAFKKENDLAQKEFLTYQAQEIEKAHLHPNEIEDLSQELASMEQFSSLENAYKDLDGYLSQGENEALSDCLSSGLSRRLAAFKGTVLEKEAEKALEGLNSLNEGLDGLNEGFSGLSFSPERLDQVNQRLFELTSLQHKYGKTTAEILLALKNLKEQLSKLETYDQSLNDLASDCEQKKKIAMEEAGKLTLEREKSALELSKAVNAELAFLGLKEGGFQISLLNQPELYENGAEEVQFLIQMNKGGKFLPLKEAASGGENSRLLLALKAAFNALSPYDTIIFDEIDTGISGSIAAKAAEKIYDISKDSFVLAITHLPQLAARADNLYYAYKESKGEKTSSHLNLLQPEQRAEETARMISGAEITPAALAAAKELIASFKGKN